MEIALTSVPLLTYPPIEACSLKYFTEISLPRNFPVQAQISLDPSATAADSGGHCLAPCTWCRILLQHAEPALVAINAAWPMLSTAAHSQKSDMGWSSAVERTGMFSRVKAIPVKAFTLSDKL